VDHSALESDLCEAVKHHPVPVHPCRALMNTTLSVADRTGRSAATWPDNEPISAACLRDLSASP